MSPTRGVPSKRCQREVSSSVSICYTYFLWIIPPVIDCLNIVQKAPPLDFSELGRLCIGSLVKTDLKIWPTLYQYGLFEPSFFAQARLRAGSEIDDDTLAAYVTRAGLKVLKRERESGHASYPLHAAAMLLSFPQVSEIPADLDWRIPEGSCPLNPYWAQHFGDLEDAVIDTMLQVRLLQRKPGAPKTYNSLVSSYHTAHFRRIAAIKLAGKDEVEQRIDTRLPGFDVRWHDTVRRQTELPLFISLITSFYKAVYEALDFKTPLAEREIDSPATIAHQPSDPEPSWPRWVLVRSVPLLLLAAFPTLINVLFSHRTLLQLLLNSLAANLLFALLAASLIGYTVRTISSPWKILQSRTLVAVILTGGAIALVGSMLTAGQESIKWTYDHIAYILTSMLFMTVATFIIAVCVSLVIVYGILMAHRYSRDTTAAPVISYPTLSVTFFILWCAACIFPPVMFPQGGLRYSPTVGTLLAFLAIATPPLFFTLTALYNQQIPGRSISPRTWAVFAAHIALSLVVMLAHQYVPEESVSGLTLASSLILLAAVMAAPLLLLQQISRQRMRDQFDTDE